MHTYVWYALFVCLRPFPIMANKTEEPFTFKFLNCNSKEQIRLHDANTFFNEKRLKKTFIQQGNQKQLIKQKEKQRDTV